MKTSSVSKPRKRTAAAPAPLDALQRLLSRLITAPSGAAEGLQAERALPRGGLGAIVVGDERLAPVERVDIYANMFFYRLLDVLREDFPATARVLGEAAFHNLITGYLLEYPPSQPSVIHCGRHLSDYLRGHPLGRKMPWLGDLASLERATLDVFHAADAAALDVSAMKAIPSDEWAGVRMRTPPALKILELGWNVAPVLRAIEQRLRWRRPVRRSCAILVWRKDDQVSWRPLAAAEHRALRVASAGARFERICDAVADEIGAARAPRKIATMLQRWLADGILMRDTPRPRRPARGISA